jgi:tetratricopeptide (TPR) repeat protein
MAAARRFPQLGRIALVCLLLALIGLGVAMVCAHLLAEYHLGQAAEALQKQRYSQALAAYRRALFYRPGSADLHLLAGRTARQAGDVLAARDYLRRCRELQRGVSEELQVEEYLLRAQTGDVDQVHSVLLPYLVQEGPLTPLVLEGLVRGYMGKYRSDLAWAFLKRWLELQPDNVEALFRRGVWYSQQQNTKDAVEDFLRAIERDPERIDARLACAEVLKADKRYAAVEEQYQAVLRQSPRNTAALVGLAERYSEAGKVEEARALVARIPEGDRDTADALWVRGKVELQADQPDKAEPLLRQALAREPRHLDACYQLMLCLRRIGREEEADEVGTRFLHIEADQKRLIAITTQELKADPQNPDLHCELGEVYMRLGVAERGLHWLHSALRLDPNHRRAHELLRDYYDGLGPEGREKADFHRRQLAGSP